MFSVSWITYSYARSGFILTFPQELQLDASEKFCLSLFNITSDVSITLNISCYGKHDIFIPTPFRNGKDGCFTWHLPDRLPPGLCDLSVQGSSGNGELTFGETREINVVDNHQITFIQTDRPFYKPGQLVKARILTITQDLKPLNSTIESISIHDPYDFQMKRWTNLKLKNGLASVDYQLYDEPVLGDWTIVAVISGRKTSQIFNVQEYVLPKFQVKLMLPKILTVATKSLQFEVCARYTYGKPVTGTFNATVCLHNKLQSWFCQQNIRPCFSIHTQIQGCQSFVVNTTKLNVTSRTYSLLCKPRLHLAVNVTEKNTGITVYKEEAGKKLWEERVKLEFLSSNYFKPFFPYYGKIKVTYPDGTPVEGEKIILAIDKLNIDDTLVSDEYGFVNFTLLNITHTTDFFFVEARTTDEWESDRKHYTVYPAKLKKQVKQWYSPSSSFITIRSELDRSLKCEESVSLDVVYSLLSYTDVEHIYYQVISKGNILFKNDIMEAFMQSSPYTPSIKGQLLQGSQGQAGDTEELLGKTEFFDISAPHGPPGWSLGAAPGPPGWSDPPAPSNMGDGDQTGGEDFDFEEEVEPSLWHFPLKLHVTEEMFPKLRVLVYFITNAGEMTADTLDFDVEPCIGNNVKMNFGYKSARPGDNVTVSVSALPGSLCSLSMVDKSVYLHGGSNLLQTSSIMKKLGSYDLTSDFIIDWQYCSATSDLPPILTPVGPPMSPGIMSGTLDDWYSPLGEFRKKRSIRQFYSNMYDSLLAFKVAGLVALTDLDLQTRPCLHDGQYLGPPILPGDPRGPIPGQGGPELPIDFTEEPDDDFEPETTSRDYFPETWLWDLVEIPSDGHVSLKEKLPDTVTQWMGNTFCTSSADGIGVSEIATLTSFQPFFLSVSLPYSVVRGEVLKLTATVFNYLPHCTALVVSVLDSRDFEMLSEGEEKQPSICICSEESKSVSFKIKPSTLGSINISVSAFLREHRATCRSTVPPRGYRHKQSTDTVVRQLLVKAEGVEEEITESYYICPQDSGSFYERTIEPEISTENLVPDSLRGWVNVMGDVMGPSLSGLEKLVALPTGCGEQNMVGLAPNIAVYQYLTATNQLTSDLEAKLQDHLYQGVQQQLKYMHDNGAYSAFGSADDFGSTWLSAFVFKTFRQALEFIYVDRKQIQTRTWEFLLTKQGEDGCFVEHGKIIGKYMQGGVVGSGEEKTRALTAYVLVAMLESFRMMRERTPPFIALAVKCIEVENLTDTYTLALTAYAMTLYKPASRFTESLLERLKNEAVFEDDLMYWKRDSTAMASGKHGAPSAEIEMTSYALLAMLTRDEHAPINSVMPIVRWLTKQRNAYGGFTSTQDTVVALQALSVFAQRVYGRGLDVAVKVDTEAGESIDFHVSRDNSLLLQQHVLRHPQSPVHVTAEGEGCVMLQTSYRFNILNKIIPETGFYLTLTTPVTREILDNNCRSRDLIICSRYQGPGNSSSMAVIEIGMISGWIPDVSTLQRLVNSLELGVKKYELDLKQPDVVNLYFDEIPREELCVAFSVVLETTVTSQQPAIAKVFDYYESGLQATILYELSECSEANLNRPDHHTGDSDLYIEGIDLGKEKDVSLDLDVSNTASELDTKKVVDSVDNQGDEAPAPSLGPACPKCITTGTVNVLHDICNKQVWTIEFSGNQLIIHVVVWDAISPEISVPVPKLLESCSECLSLLQQKDQKTLTFLEVHDWSDLATNIIQSETVILPWSDILQKSVQQVMKRCPSWKE